VVLRELDDEGRLGLRDPTPEVLAGLWEHTRGFPRALEAIKAILEGDPCLTPADVIDRTRDLPEDRVVEVLVGQAFELLDQAARQVMQGLAVFPAPVSAIGVDFLLQSVNPTIYAAPILSRLVRRQLVRVDQGHFHLHPVDRAYALGTIPPGQPGDPSTVFTLAGLRARAAEYYAQIRTPRETWRTLDDIGPQLAEFDLRCEAADYATAATVLVDISFDHLQKWGHTRLAAGLHERLTGQLTDPDGEGANLTNLGLCYADLGQTRAAIDHYRQALAIAREVGYRQGEAADLGNLGNCYAELGQIQTAIDHYRQALAIAREIGDRQGEAADLGSLGNCYAKLGQIQTAIDHHQQALVIAREIGHRQGEAIHLGNLGNRYADLGQTQTAIQHHRQALAIAREIGHPYGEALALVCLGNSAVDQGERDEAGELFREAIGIGEQTGNAQVLSNGRTSLAGCQLLAGDLDGARATAGQAAAVDYANDRAMIALLTGITWLRQDQPDHAETAFTRALTAADTRLTDSPDDYAHLDTRALVLCGLALTNPQTHSDAIAEAVQSFRHARRITSASGITTRTLRLLDQITPVDPGDTLEEAQAAAGGQARTATTHTSAHSSPKRSPPTT
jgi:tetratricopeptide (TPR) repeat protein